MTSLAAWSNQQVGVRAKERHPAARPPALAERPLHVLGRLAQHRPPGPGDRHAEERLPRLLPVLAVARLELALGLRLPRPVPVRHRVVRRPLEDVELRRDGRDLGRDLDPGRPGADQPDPLPGEVDALGRPPRGVMPGPRERLKPRQRRHLVRRQAPHRGDEEPRRHRRPVLRRHRPLGVIVRPDGRRHPRVELDMRPQPEPVGHVAEVPQDLRLGRVALAPRPFLLELGRERERVVLRLHIAPRARIAVPEPGPADPAPGLERPHRQPRRPQRVHRVDPGEPGPHHDHIQVRHRHSSFGTPIRR